MQVYTWAVLQFKSQEQPICSKHTYTRQLFRLLPSLSMSSAHRSSKISRQLRQHPRQICRTIREGIQLWKELLPCSLDPDPTGKGPHPRKGLSSYFQTPTIIELKVSYLLTTFSSKHADHKWKQKHCVSKYGALYSSVLFYGFVSQSLIFQSYTEDRELSGIQMHISCLKNSSVCDTSSILNKTF